MDLLITIIIRVKHMKHSINLNTKSLQRQFIDDRGVYKLTNLIKDKTFIGSYSNLSLIFIVF